MTETTASQVKELRERTGAGMMDCKRALQQTGNDIETAIELLRAKGAAAEKRSSRETREGVIEAYIHHSKNVGVLLELNSETDFVARTSDFQELARDLAMHIAASAPIALSPEDVPEEVVARERAIYLAQVKEERKPENIADKIVEGKLRKFFEESTLLKQKYVKDPDITVADRIAETQGKLGEKIVVSRFVRFQLGQS